MDDNKLKAPTSGNKPVSIDRGPDFASTFQKASSKMVATNERAYGGEWSDRFHTNRLKDYTPEQVDKIIDSGSLLEQQALSRNYFEKDGFYRKLLIYYANLYMYYGILVPNPINNKNLSKDYIQKRYFNAMNFIDKIGLQDFFQHCAINAIVDGVYYGAIQTLDKEHFTVLDLPLKYCCTRYKNKDGIDIIEFDVSFFDTITDPDLRKTTLRVYPSKVSSWYRR